MNMPEIFADDHEETDYQLQNYKRSKTKIGIRDKCSA